MFVIFYQNIDCIALKLLSFFLCEVVVVKKNTTLLHGIYSRFTHILQLEYYYDFYRIDIMDVDVFR
jgi:hypothetical protein